MPSPTSGKRNSSAMGTSQGQDATDSLNDTLSRRQVVFFELGERKDGIKTRDALDWPMQRPQGFFVNLGHNLGAQPTGAGRFVYYHSAAGLFHRGNQRRHVHGSNSAHINNLDAHPFSAQQFCSLIDLA